jgi:hypothetical protein
MNFRDAELLSAYLDHRLDAGELARVEKRLAVDAGLRPVLDDLRVARGLLKRAPRRRAPRNFMLNPSDVRVLAPRPPLVPALRYAGAIASILFLFAVGTNTLLPSLERMRATAPLVYGVGGGAPETPPEALAAAPAPGMPVAPQDNAPAAAEPFAKSAPSERAPIAAAPVPAVWLMALALAAVMAIGLSAYLDRYTRRKFRSRHLE